MSSPSRSRFVVLWTACAALAVSGRAAPAGASPPAQVIGRYVVTGSYLPDAATVNASPVVTLGRTAIEDSGATDPLRLLQSLTPYFSGNGNVGNEVNFEGFGESYVALRNLPTLVLVDGRRVADSPFTSTLSPGTQPTVDLNTIPLAMVQRIDVLKDSASTVYGSDAVGGVINLILRKNYNGAEAGVRFGSDEHGGYRTKDAWFTAGVAKHGLSLTVGLDYFKSTNLPTTARPLAMLGPAGLVAHGQNPAVLAAYISSVYAGRNGAYLIAGSPLAAGAPGYNPAFTSLPAKPGPTAAPESMSQLVADGYYLPINTTPRSRNAGGTASILNTARYGFSIVVPNERRQAYASLSQDILGRRLQAFGEFLFSKTTNGGSSLAPAPLAGVAASNLTIPADNPYNLFGVTIGVGGVPNAPGVVTRLDEIGPRWSDNTVKTYRLVAGLRGAIGNRWTWETAFNVAQANGTEVLYGGANGAIMNQLLTPLLDSTGTQYVYDAQGRPLSVYVRNGQHVPVYDFFGTAGVNAPATIDALRTNLHRTANVNQRGVDLRVSGKLFDLPTGTVSVAFGGETRRESTTSAADPIFNAGLALGYIPLSNVSGDRSTSAAFAEVHIPLAQPANAVPLAYRADISAALRYEHISPGGDATMPKLGLHWLPFNDQFLIRATYSRGFVAPSIFALYGPAQGAVPTVAVPEGNGQTGPGGATGPIVSGQFFGRVVELGNPTLTPARSESYTFGAVYSPRRIRGLNLSADYYHIRQDKVGGFDFGYIVADLNAKGAASAYAPNFRFADGTQMTSNAPNQVTSTNAGALSVVYDPVGDLWTDGLDLGADYRRAVAGLGSFDVGADANVLFNFQARTNPRAPYLQYAREFTESINGRGNPQGVLPGYSLRAHLQHTLGRVHTSVEVSYLPAVNAPGTAFGAPAGTPNILRADLKPYTIPSYTTVDLAVACDLPDFGRSWARHLTLTVGANNLFNREAPFVPGASTEANTVESTYDIIGRFLFAEVRKEF